MQELLARVRIARGPPPADRLGCACGGGRYYDLPARLATGPQGFEEELRQFVRQATVEESVRLQRIWAETAARIAEIESIDSKYQKMADDLAAHFGRLAAEQEDEDDVIALLLS